MQDDDDDEGEDDEGEEDDAAGENSFESCHMAGLMHPGLIWLGGGICRLGSGNHMLTWARTYAL